MYPLVWAIAEYGRMDRLTLASNGITDTTVKAIYYAFHSQPRSLRVLDLGMYLSTNDMGETTNRMGDAGAAWIAKLLSCNTGLLFLSISQNCITRGGFDLIADAMGHNTRLQYFQYAQYGTTLGDVGVKRQLKANRKNADVVYEDVRELKFGKAIHNIYSVYRNKICTMHQK